MELSYLHEFIHLAEVQNYLNAADDLFISQSSLSKHIMSLEKDLGVTLFERNTRRLSLTKDGELFLKYARQIESLMADYRRSRSLLSIDTNNMISIASTDQMMMYSIMDILVDYKKDHPSCRLNIITKPHNKLIEVLRSRKADLIWIGETKEERENEIPGCVRVPYLNDRLVVILPEGHAFYGQEDISIEKLKDETFLIQSDVSIENNLFITFCHEHGFEPNITTLPIESILKYADQGVGIPVLLQSIAQNHRLAKGIPYVRIQNSPVVYVGFIHLEDQILTKSEADFLTFYQESIC